ncbi:MAG: PIN domain-containing protein [Egibacteraceae bacterium]
MARLSDVLLVDTSVWHRATHADVMAAWRDRIDRIAVTPPMRLEVLYSARSAVDYRDIAEELDALHQIPCGEAAFRRAEDVQRLLGERSALHHRSVQITDLLIAAAAELADATVWHYDADYDRIAEVTGQPTEWVVPRGSL